MSTRDTDGHFVDMMENKNKALYTYFKNAGNIVQRQFFCFFLWLFGSCGLMPSLTLRAYLTFCLLGKKIKVQNLKYGFYLISWGLPT